MDSSIKKQIDTWAENIIKESNDRLLFCSVLGLDDSSGWGKTLKQSVKKKREDDLKEKRGFLLSGPIGSGRHQAAYSILQYMCSDRANEVSYEDNYKALFVSGDDFCDIPKNEIKSYLDTLIDKISGPLCMVLENPEEAPECKTLLKSFGSILCLRYALVDDYAHLLPIVITNDASIVPSILRDRLTLCKMTMPNKIQRRNLICNLESDGDNNSMLYEVVSDSTSKITVNDLIDLTEGMSYGEIRDFIETGSLFVSLPEDQSNPENLGSMIESQLVMQTFEPNESAAYVLGERSYNSETNSTRDRLHERLISFLDEVPELIDRLPAGGAAIDLSLLKPAEKEEKKDNEEKNNVANTVFDQQKTLSETEKMSSKEIVNELFQDDAEDMMLLARKTAENYVPDENM